VSYQILLRRTVQRQLDKLTKYEYETVVKAISALEEEPRPRGVKKLSESGLWRVRAGRYRIVYSIDDRERQVVLVRVARRSEDTYKGVG